jgi:hypothetical protein
MSDDSFPAEAIAHPTPTTRGSAAIWSRLIGSPRARRSVAVRIHHRTGSCHPKRTNDGNEEGLTARGFLPPRDRDRRLTPAPPSTSLRSVRITRRCRASSHRGPSHKGTPTATRRRGPGAVVSHRFGPRRRRGSGGRLCPGSGSARRQWRGRHGGCFDYGAAAWENGDELLVALKDWQVGERAVISFPNALHARQRAARHPRRLAAVSADAPRQRR